MKKKVVTHAAVQAAIKKFLKEGGKIKKLEEDNSGLRSALSKQISASSSASR